MGRTYRETSPSLPTVPSPEVLCSWGMLLPPQPHSMEGHCSGLGFLESKHQKPSSMSPSLRLRGHGATRAATAHPVFQAVADRGFQVAPGGHSSGTTFLAGLILGRMCRHAQQPHAAPAWPEAQLSPRWPRLAPAPAPPGLQLQQALSRLPLPETLLQLRSAHSKV